MIGIYKITNPKGKIYIGQSANIEQRFTYYSKLYCKGQRKLYYSLQKYGPEKHSFIILTECEISDLNKLERYYQELYDCVGKNGLNLMLQNTETQRKIMSIETRQIISQNLIGRLQSKEAKLSISIKNSGENNGMFGHRHSEEFKLKRRQHKHTQESLEKISTRSAGGNNPNAKMVLDLNTGVYYSHIGDAAKVLGVPYDRLKQWLNGRRKNLSCYIYC